MLEYCTKGWVILGESKPTLGSNYTKVFVFYIKKRQLTLYFCKFTFGNHQQKNWMFITVVFTQPGNTAQTSHVNIFANLRLKTIKNSEKFMAKIIINNVYTYEKYMAKININIEIRNRP